MKKFLALSCALMLSQLALAETFQVNTQVITVNPEDIKDLDSDLLISKKLITEENLQEAVLDSAMAQPQQIRDFYRYTAYFINADEQRLGIGQMLSTRKKGSSTNILGVKNKEIVLISCLTEKPKARWNTNECAKAIKQIFGLEITAQQIKENEKEFILPKT